jgi:hypothetical protein
VNTYQQRSPTKPSLALCVDNIVLQLCAANVNNICVWGNVGRLHIQDLPFRRKAGRERGEGGRRGRDEEME